MNGDISKPERNLGVGGASAASGARASPPAGPAAPHGSAIDRIKARARERLLERLRAGRPGDAVADWLHAEREGDGSPADPIAAVQEELKPRAKCEDVPGSLE